MRGTVGPGLMKCPLVSIVSLPWWLSMIINLSGQESAGAVRCHGVADII